MPCVLGPALYMQAIHGGKAKNDKIDAQKIAVLLRGGMLPQAYIYPADMRSPGPAAAPDVSYVPSGGIAAPHPQYH